MGKENQPTSLADHPDLSLAAGAVVHRNRCRSPISKHGRLAYCRCCPLYWTRSCALVYGKYPFCFASITSCADQREQITPCRVKYPAKRARAGNFAIFALAFDLWQTNDTTLADKSLIVGHSGSQQGHVSFIGHLAIRQIVPGPFLAPRELSVEKEGNSHRPQGPVTIKAYPHT